MDKLFTLSNLSVNTFLSPDKCDSCLGITVSLAVHRFWKSTEPLKTHQHITAKTLANAIKNPALR